MSAGKRLHYRLKQGKVKYTVLPFKGCLQCLEMLLDGPPANKMMGH